MTASALYAGTVRHRRFGRPAREFTHPVHLALLDLEELPTLLGGRLVRPRPGIVRVRRRDLLGGPDPATPLDVAEAVRELVWQRTGVPIEEGPVRVLTHPRTLGTCFNPVSFYYAFDGAEQLQAVVADVTNTPWGDRHAYVLRHADPGRPTAVLRGAHAKALHVSPFQPMERAHHWAATAPGPTLSVHIENRATPEHDPDFDATLRLHRRPLTARSLRAMVARHPAGTARVLTLIYGHAVALKLRGARHFRPPSPAEA